METPNINILVWNVRGLNNPRRGAMVRSAVEDAGAALVCLVESKLNRVDTDLVRSMMGPNFLHFSALPAVGTAGGILVAWRDDLIKAHQWRTGQFSMTIRVDRAMAEPWFRTIVYGPTDDVLKPMFLQEIRDTRALCPGDWAIAGDFKLIVDSADTSNSLVNRRMMGRFRRYLSDLELLETDLIRRRYTWCNERRAPTLVKLDRWRTRFL